MHTFRLRISIPQNDDSCHFQTVHVKNIEQSGIKNIIRRNMIADNIAKYK